MGEAYEKQGNLRFSFSEPTIVEKESYVQLNSEGTDSWIFDAGSPMLPRRIETVTLPFGATDTEHCLRCYWGRVQGVVSEDHACSTTHAIER